MKSIELVYDRLSVDWTPEEDEAFNEVEKQSNLGKQILQEIKPKREWVGLTVEEASEIYNSKYNEYAVDLGIADFLMIYMAIEAKLKEKNNG